MTKDIKPHLALIGCNVIWALNYPLFHIVFPKYATPLAMLTISIVVAAFLSFIPLLWSRTEKIEKGDIKYLIVAGILSGVMRKGLVIFGVAHTSPIDASIIAALIPVSALIISVIMGLDRFNGKRIIGILMGLGGAVAIIIAGNSSLHDKAGMEGNLLMLCYTVVAAFYMVWLQPIFKRYKPITIMQWVFSIASIFLIPIGAKSVMDLDFAQMPTHVLWSMAFLFLIPTFIPNLLFVYGIKSIRPSISSIYSYLQPVLAIALSVWLGIDKLSWEIVVFAVIIIIGVTIVLRSETVK